MPASTGRIGVVRSCVVCVGGDRAAPSALSASTTAIRTDERGCVGDQLQHSSMRRAARAGPLTMPLEEVLPEKFRHVVVNRHRPNTCTQRPAVRMGSAVAYKGEGTTIYIYTFALQQASSAVGALRAVPARVPRQAAPRRSSSRRSSCPGRYSSHTSFTAYPIHIHV